MQQRPVSGILRRGSGPQSDLTAQIAGLARQITVEHHESPISGSIHLPFWGPYWVDLSRGSAVRRTSRPTTGFLSGIVEPDGTAAAPPENSDSHFLPLQGVMLEMSFT
jgi:hypothetical protein